jgi:ABC-type uncharacterized transport system substrate-binding protein
MVRHDRGVPFLPAFWQTETVSEGAEPLSLIPSLKSQALGAASLAAGMLWAGPAWVHPHVFAEASLEVKLDDGASVHSLRHVWRFDDLFSSTVLVEFDKNSDLKLDEAELQAVANTIFASLAEFDYFQLVSSQGKTVAMKAPDQLIATFENNQLVVFFESQPAETLKLAGKVDFGVYDPTFYTAIDFTEDANMKVDGLPASCKRQVIRPDPDEAIAQNQQSLTEDFFNNPGGNDLGSIFATRLELDCQAQG